MKKCWYNILIYKFVWYFWLIYQIQFGISSCNSDNFSIYCVCLWVKVGESGAPDGFPAFTR
jgi:hypothetical protein